MKRLVLGIALLALAGCGGGSSKSAATTTTTADPRTAFVKEIDAASLRNGYSDAQLLEAGDGICAAARKEATHTRSSESDSVSYAINHASDAIVSGKVLLSADAMNIARITARVLCPDFTDTINTGIDEYRAKYTTR